VVLTHPIYDTPILRPSTPTNENDHISLSGVSDLPFDRIYLRPVEAYEENVVMVFRALSPGFDNDRRLKRIKWYQKA